MRLVSVIVVLVSALYVATAQDDGKYRPPSTTTTVRPSTTRYRPYRPYDPFNQYRYTNEGRYQGRYVGGNDGRYYGGNSGRYVPSNDGRYVHRDGKYQHVGDGDRGKYKHVEGPAGSNVSKQGPSGGGSGASGSSTEAVASPPTTSAPQPIYVPTTALPVLAKKVQLNVAPRLADNDGWKIIRLENQVRQDGYNYVFETQNGINAEESGKIESDGKGSEGLRSQGFYQYVGDDGQVYRVDYVADTNGFVPQGDHIPKVPPAIEKLLSYLASQPK
ncbi:larval cuticle protein LCP-30-like [Topomyia yanbarensis]|uniref:larval cuticle protein LCP-30-like n=1 Tax=Topomyia yanbarensis TaxID=2498891 RepID=UPI00273CD33E|nr:larval cuticle protein LCP-30-like [Topomyia yanbarensis]